MRERPEIIMEGKDISTYPHNEKMVIEFRTANCYDTSRISVQDNLLNKVKISTNFCKNIIVKYLHTTIF